MDFYSIKERTVKGVIEIYPDFKICRSKDLMIRGKSFYAIWDKEKGLWSTDEYDVQRLIDAELYSYAEEVKKRTDLGVYVRYLNDFSSNSWVQFRNYISHVSDNAHQLDETLTFQDTKVKKSDYISKRLPYKLCSGNMTAYEELISTLYEPEERQKLEWAIGSIISGDSRYIQKFIVLYGDPGGGKSTIINIVQKLFSGYYTTFDAKALVSSSNAFSTEVFKSNPLVAVQHDGDLSRIEDNTKLNSIVSHEEMTVNEKYKPSYTTRINCFLFLGSNKPVKITDAKAGLIRRLIDVTPSGKRLPSKRYYNLYDQIDFELGAIAAHCLEVYNSLGKTFYDSYKPMKMIFQTDFFFNFVEANYFTFCDEVGISLTQAYDIYKKYCEDSYVEVRLPRHKFREELKNYFSNFEEVTRVNGRQIRSYYSGFLKDKFSLIPSIAEDSSDLSTDFLTLDKSVSILDDICKDCFAQYADSEGHPKYKWDNTKTHLKDINTKRLHFLKPNNPNHIVIDFDIRDSEGNKSVNLNLEAAKKFPPTYAEFSKSGNGVHLHYIYDGDVSELSRLYSKDIEIKVFNGNASLRRKLTKCNNLPIAKISSGLPRKEVKKMVNSDVLENEKHLRALIFKNLNKEIHPNTTPSIHFIKDLLDEAYESGLIFDVTDLRPAIYDFALRSSNQSEHCVALIDEMHFQSDNEKESNVNYMHDELVFFDCEVFPNVLILCWLPDNSSKCIRMFNPTPQDIDKIFSYKLVGYNCRNYDNSILYGRRLGYNNFQVYTMSRNIISKSKNAGFREAKNVSYTDVFDFCSKKQSLKKWEIELKLPHKESRFPWDKPLPREHWDEVADYCENDVRATKAVFYANMADFKARKMLSDISGLTVNDTTNQNTIKITFGDNKHPQNEFNYRDLSQPVLEIDPEMYEYLKKNTVLPLGNGPLFEPYKSDLPWDDIPDQKSILPYFPGYKFEFGKSTYRGELVGEGGYVYAEPGIYEHVKVFDVASMHPSSIESEYLFGPYTNNFSQLKQARIHIKHGDFDKVRGMFGGKLDKYLDNPEEAKALSYALKIAINSVYGLTAAKFDNPFKDERNVDNIVAKRGALFMIDLKHAVQEKGFQVVHIKTDSIKIANPTPEIEQFILDFGRKYGYIFEIEDVYRKMCLVNDAVYIAQHEDGTWTPTGAEFAHPFIFKKLFSKEPITFDDLCETKATTSALYLDMNESLPDVSLYEKEKERRAKLASGKKVRLNPDFSNLTDDEIDSLISDGHDYIFVGKVGLFCPIKSGCGGALLLRQQGEKYNSVSGAKGYRWLEASTVKDLHKEDDIDMGYFEDITNDAIASIEKFGSFEDFVS